MNGCPLPPQAALWPLLLGLAVFPAAPAPAWAEGALSLAGTLQMNPPVLVPGKEAILTVPVKTGKEAAGQVRLQVRVGEQVIGELAGGPLGANQARTFSVKLAVPATAKESLTLTVWAQGALLGQLAARVQIPRASIPPGTAPGQPGDRCGGTTGVQCDAGLFCNLSAQAACSPQAAGVCAVRPRVCPPVYTPVCGCDGKTYGSACSLELAGASPAHVGPCR